MGHCKVEYLTDRQEAILRYIRDTIADTGEAPTMREIGAHVGLRSRSAIHYQLREMEAKGAIVRERHQPCGIRLT
ncbi:LexA family protein [Streptomyces sp. Tue6028]|uniref:LexA family protein n=1 Tax=Streptomyces sp. Tue6028 TaxID=2036037 RepID=UPI003D74F1D0